jgi:GNAT superfamily N-acetyltransferase
MHLSFSHGENADHNEAITERLIAMNRGHLATLPIGEGASPAAEPLEIYALDSEGAVVGGLVGRTHTIPYWLEITVLWVDKPLRGHGLGRQLVEQAEQAAVQRGCRYSRLATSDYQAPGFYPRVGYTLYGTLENCPPGVTCYYYRKDLGIEPTASILEEVEAGVDKQAANDMTRSGV